MSGDIPSFIPVLMPELGESVADATIVQWLKSEGDFVSADEPLLEVATDKVDTQIPAPATGYLRRIFAQEDETVRIGGDLGQIEEIASDNSVAELNTTGLSAVDGQQPEPGPYALLAPDWTMKVIDPTVSQWFITVGEYIRENDLILEVTTQHGDIGIPSEVSGLLLEILVLEDRLIEPGSVLALIDTTALP